MTLEHKHGLISDRGTVKFYGILDKYRNRSGYLSIFGIDRILHDGNGILELQGLLDSQDLFYNYEKSMFAVGEKYSINIDVYKSLSELSNTVFEITNELVSFRNSSFLLKNSARICSENNYKDILAVKYAKYVLVDQKSRRSEKFPDWFMEKYRKYKDVQVDSDLVVRRPLLIPPADVFETSVKAKYSDLDSNNHVTASVYYSYCHDAAAEAALSGYYRFFTDICWYPVVETDVSFLGECLAGNEIQILTWQDKDFRTIFFSLYLKDKNIFQATMRFDDKKYENWKYSNRQMKK